MTREKYYKAGYVLFLNLAIITAIIIILKLFNLLNEDIFLSKNILSVVLIASLTITIVCKHNLDNYRNRNGQFISSIFETSPYFFISVLIILAVNQFMKIAFITDRNLIISSIGVAFGFLAFYSNRGRIEHELEDEKQKEEHAEQQRYHEFAHKFPRISRVWGLRNVVRWMYKEGWWYSCGLIAIVVLGFVLRIWNLDYLQGTDNFNILAAKALYQNGTFSYDRGIHITYMVYFLFKIFGAELWVARIPMILMGLLSVFLIYILGKMFSKKTGIIASFLLAISPVAIEKSTFVREYSEIFMWSLVSLIILLKIYISEKDNKKLVKKLFMASLIILSLIYFYSTITNTATIRSVIAIPIFATPILLFSRAYIEKRNKTLKFYCLLFIPGLVLFVFLVPWVVTFFHSGISYQPYWFKMFFDPFVSTPMQWFSFSSLSPLFILGIFMMPLLLKKDLTKILQVLFWLILLLFILKVPNVYGYLHSRYLYFVYPIFITLIAIALYSFLSIIKFYKNKLLVNLLIIFFIFSNFLILSNTYHSSIHDLSVWKDSPPDERQPTASGSRNYFYDIFDILIANNFSNKYPLIIQGENQFFISWYFNYNISRSYNPSGTDWYDAGEKVYVIDPYINFSELDYAIENYEEGFLIGHSSEYPERDYEYEAVSFNYIGSVEEYKIYKWSLNKVY